MVLIDVQALKGLEIDIPWTPPLQHLTNLVRMGEDEKEFFAEKGSK